MRRAKKEDDVADLTAVFENTAGRYKVIVLSLVIVKKLLMLIKKTNIRFGDQLFKG